MKKDEIKNLVTNRRARHEYFIDDTLEAGIELKGTEVKSLRSGKSNIQDAYISFSSGEAFVENMHISPYEQGNIFNVDPVRPRKLLLHKKEISRLIGETTQKGYTLVPLSVYLKRGLVKVELGLARGKKLHDKRETLAKKDADRRMQRELKNYK